MINTLASIFIQAFGYKHEYASFAPGRANIIGEHTDYNHGFVLPFATSQGISFVYAPSRDNSFRIIAANTNDRIDISRQDINNSTSIGWFKFIQQVLKVYSDVPVTGFDMVFGGDLPVAAGVSSSSALTCGVISVIEKINGLGHVAEDMVLKAVTAERGYGVQGGIMDQFTIFNGHKDKVIMLDCHDNSFEHIDFLRGDYSFYLFNTQVKHNLLDSEYNQRHNQCLQGVDWITSNYKPVASLRDITLADLQHLRPLMDKMLYNRVSYVVEENARVLLTKETLINNDAIALGHLLYQSHTGLSEKYEVSCPELDWLVEYTKNNTAFLGARMMGGGFGGCTINLIKGSLNEHTQNQISSAYQKTFGLLPEIIQVKPSSGIMEIASRG